MKLKLIFVLSLVVATFILLGFGLYQSSNGPHGGAMKQADNYYFIEMKNPYGNFFAYLLDKNYKLMSNKGISCEVRFFAHDNTTTDVALKPFGEDGFSAEVSIPYQSCRITFQVFGKPVTTLFENETLMVEKKKQP